MITVKRFGAGDCDLSDVLDIVDNLRPEDQYEFTAGGIVDNHQAAAYFMTASQNAYVFFYKDRPAFAFGTIRAPNGIDCLFGFGTPQAVRCMPFMTRWGLTYWLPKLFEEEGSVRVEVRVPTASTHSIEWLTKGCGMIVECIVKHASATGEPMAQLAFTLDEYQIMKSRNDVRHQNA